MWETVTSFPNRPFYVPAGESICLGKLSLDAGDPHQATEIADLFNRTVERARIEISYHDIYWRSYTFDFEGTQLLAERETEFDLLLPGIVDDQNDVQLNVAARNVV